MKQKGQGLVEYLIVLVLLFVVLYVIYAIVVKSQNNIIFIVLAVLISGGIGGFFIYNFQLLDIRDWLGQLDWVRTGVLTMTVLASILLGYFIYNFFITKSLSIQNAKTADTFLLAGKIIEPTTGNWNNNRMVLVYEKNIEIARGVTFRGEFPESGQGVLDGLFIIEVPNTYRVSLGDLNYADSPFNFSLLKRKDGFFKKQEIPFYWFPEFDEGSTKIISVPSKNLVYTVMVLSGDVSTLPKEVVGGKTELRDGFIFTAPDATPVPDLGVSGNYYLQNVTYNVSTENREANKFTVPINNCKSDQELRNPYSYAQTFVHKYSEETTSKTGVEAKVPELDWLKIVAELQQKYGFEDSQINTVTINYEMIAAPHTFQLYTVTWIEVWEHGVANVIKDNQSLNVPFEVKTNLIYAVTGETQACP